MTSLKSSNKQVAVDNLSVFFRWRKAGGRLTASRKERLKKRKLYPHMRVASGEEGIQISSLLYASAITFVLLVMINAFIRGLLPDPNRPTFLRPTAFIPTPDFSITNTARPSFLLPSTSTLVPHTTQATLAPSATITRTFVPVSSTPVRLIPTAQRFIWIASPVPYTLPSVSIPALVIPTSAPLVVVTSAPIYVVVTATLTPEATFTPTDEPTFTPEPTLTPTDAPTVTPEPTFTPTPEPTATPTLEPTFTPTLEPSATPTPTATLEPTATLTPEPTLEATATPE